MDLNWAYYYFQNIISKEDCNKIIELGLNQIKEDKKKRYKHRSRNTWR